MRLSIEKLVYGGSGLARTDLGVVFVPRTAPGDVVEAEITEQKKDYALARVIEVLEPSPDRQEPFCPNYETAGCCHWQHIKYERQLDIKEGIIRESLKRLGRLEWDGVISRLTGPDRNYRMRATFHVTPQRELGFVREKSNDVAAVTQCVSLVHELNDFIEQGNAMIRAAGFERVREVHVVSGPAITATFVSDAREMRRVSFSNQPPSIEANGVQYRLQAETFFQANRFLLPAFVREVLDQAGTSPTNVLDLYCGSGFFSLPLARLAKQVIGVESDGRAVKQARENAKLNREQNVGFFHGDVDAALESADLKPQVVVLNPPRAGTGVKNAARITELKPERVVYVSCNPATFAREAAVLVEKGYNLQRVTMIDQFPNTYHIELVGLFTKSL